MSRSASTPTLTAHTSPMPSSGGEGAANLAGKAVVVTGGATGIGRATAILLASKGAKVLIYGRDEKDLEPALGDIRRAGGEAHGLTADQTKEHDVKRVFAEADRKLGGVDILINNAAVTAGSIFEKGWDDWQYGLNANLLGYLACCREAIDRMRKRGGGHVVNVGSMSADLREEGSDIYVATKAAIQGFSESLRKQINKENIRLTLIEPGLVGTPMVGMDTSQQRQKEQSHELLKPEDIAQCVYFCLTLPPRCDVVEIRVRPTKQLI